MQQADSNPRPTTLLSHSRPLSTQWAHDIHDAINPGMDVDKPALETALEAFQTLDTPATMAGRGIRILGSALPLNSSMGILLSTFDIMGISIDEKALAALYVNARQYGFGTQNWIAAVEEGFSDLMKGHV